MNNLLSYQGVRRGAVVGSALVVLSSFTMPGASDAQTRVINLPADMCNVLAEQPLNQRILSDVRNRANFADILAYVEENCGALTGLLIGPTGSIIPPADNGGGNGENGGLNGGTNGGNGGTNGGNGGTNGGNGGTNGGNGGNGGTTPPDRPDDLGNQPFDPDDYPDVDNGENDIPSDETEDT